MKKVLITGGAGFVGSHLTDALLARGYSVRILDNLSPQVHGGSARPDYLSPEAELMVGDVRDPNAVTRALSGVDVVFHLAAAVGVGQSMYQISEYMGTNTQGTAVMLQALLDTRAPVEKLIVASSMSIYGEGQYRCPACGPVTAQPRSAAQLQARRWDPTCPRCDTSLQPVATAEDKPLQATSFYALSKKDQEEMCLIYGRTYGLPVVALRYFNIYGSRQALSNPYTGVAAIFASRLLNRKPPILFEDGRQLRDFVSVHDVVQANLLALENKSADGTALNIGSGQPISVREVADALAAELNIAIAPQSASQARAGDIRHCFADITAARNTLGYAPQHNFRQGVKELAAWVAQQTATDRAPEAVAELKRFGLTA